MSNLIFSENEADFSLFSEIKLLIEQAKKRVAIAVNAELSLLNWNIGKQIYAHILKEERAEYGKKIIQQLADALTQEYGRGFTRTNLLYFVQFAAVFPDISIVHTLCGQFTMSNLS